MKIQKDDAAVQAIEDLKTTINQINDAIKKIKSTGIRERALHILIQQAAGTVRSKPIPLPMISAVLDGMTALKEYVFKDEEEK